MNATRLNLLGLSLPQLSDFVQNIGEPRYRGKQLYQWIYAKGATAFEEMSDLGKSFRQSLSDQASLEGVMLVQRQQSDRDGTTKFLFELADGLKIESVLIPPRAAFVGREAAQEEEQRRLTLCVSTQVGCPLDCLFCATATMGYKRNLTVGEIVDQVLQVRRIASRPITNIVFMGMGEPMMNYDNVMMAAEILTGGVGIASRRITVSTAGWADKIRQMGDERRKVKLAVSLHAAIDRTRSLLMPVNRKYPIPELMKAIAHYYEHTRRRVTFEYIFFEGVNDSDKEVKELITLARRVPCKINIIPYHSIASVGPGGLAASLRPSPRMEEIAQRLREHHLTVMVRSSAGEDIDAACGQLAVKEQHRLRSRVPAGPRKRTTGPARRTGPTHTIIAKG